MDDLATQVYEDNDFTSTQQVSYPVNQDNLPAVQIGVLHVGSNTYPIKKGINKIGRHPECNIILNDQTVSKKHAEIEANSHDASAWLCDLHSSNKTKLNNSVLRSGRYYELKDGSNIQLGIVRAVFKVCPPMHDTLVAETPLPPRKKNEVIVPETPDSSAEMSSTSIPEDNVSMIPGTQNDREPTFRRPSVPQRNSTNSKKKSLLYDSSVDDSFTVGDKENVGKQRVSIHDMETQKPYESQSETGVDIHDVETQKICLSEIRILMTKDQDIHDVETQREETEDSSADSGAMDVQYDISIYDMETPKKTFTRNAEDNTRDENSKTTCNTELSRIKVREDLSCLSITDEDEPKEDAKDMQKNSEEDLQLSPTTNFEEDCSELDISRNLLGSQNLLEHIIEDEELTDQTESKLISVKPTDADDVDEINDKSTDDENIFDAATQVKIYDTGKGVSRPDVFKISQGADDSEKTNQDVPQNYSHVGSKDNEKSLQDTASDDSDTDEEGQFVKIALEEKQNVSSSSEKRRSDVNEIKNNHGSSKDSEDMFDMPTQRVNVTNKNTWIKKSDNEGNVDFDAPTQVIHQTEKPETEAAAKEIDLVPTQILLTNESPAKEVPSVSLSKSKETVVDDITEMEDNVATQIITPPDNAAYNIHDKSPSPSNENPVEEDPYPSIDDLDYETAPTQLINEVEREKPSRMSNVSNKIILNDTLERNLNAMFGGVNENSLEDQQEISTQVLRNVLQSSQSNDEPQNKSPKSEMDDEPLTKDEVKRSSGQRKPEAASLTSRNTRIPNLTDKKIDSDSQTTEHYFCDLTSVRKRNVLTDLEDLVDSNEETSNDKTKKKRVDKSKTVDNAKDSVYNKPSIRNAKNPPTPRSKRKNKYKNKKVVEEIVVFKDTKDITNDIDQGQQTESNPTSSSFTRSTRKRKQKEIKNLEEIAVSENMEDVTNSTQQAQPTEFNTTGPSTLRSTRKRKEEEIKDTEEIAVSENMKDVTNDTEQVQPIEFNSSSPSSPQSMSKNEQEEIKDLEEITVPEKEIIVEDLTNDTEQVQPIEFNPSSPSSPQSMSKNEQEEITVPEKEIIVKDPTNDTEQVQPIEFNPSSPSSPQSTSKNEQEEIKDLEEITVPEKEIIVEDLTNDTEQVQPIEFNPSSPSSPQSMSKNEQEEIKDLEEITVPEKEIIVEDLTNDTEQVQPIEFNPSSPSSPQSMSKNEQEEIKDLEEITVPEKEIIVEDLTNDTEQVQPIEFNPSSPSSPKLMSKNEQEEITVPEKEIIVKDPTNDTEQVQPIEFNPSSPSSPQSMSKNEQEEIKDLEEITVPEKEIIVEDLTNDTEQVQPIDFNPTSPSSPKSMSRNEQEEIKDLEEITVPEKEIIVEDLTNDTEQVQPTEFNPTSPSTPSTKISEHEEMAVPKNMEKATNDTKQVQSTEFNPASPSLPRSTSKNEQEEIEDSEETTVPKNMEGVTNDTEQSEPSKANSDIPSTSNSTKKSETEEPKVIVEEMPVLENIIDENFEPNTSNDTEDVRQNFKTLYNDDEDIMAGLPEVRISGTLSNPPSPTSPPPVEHRTNTRTKKKSENAASKKKGVARKTNRKTKNIEKPASYQNIINSDSSSRSKSLSESSSINTDTAVLSIEIDEEVNKDSKRSTRNTVVGSSEISKESECPSDGESTFSTNTVQEPSVQSDGKTRNSNRKNVDRSSIFQVQKEAPVENVTEPVKSSRIGKRPLSTTEMNESNVLKKAQEDVANTSTSTRSTRSNARNSPIIRHYSANIVNMETNKNSPIDMKDTENSKLPLDQMVLKDKQLVINVNRMSPQDIRDSLSPNSPIGLVAKNIVIDTTKETQIDVTSKTRKRKGVSNAEPRQVRSKRANIGREAVVEDDSSQGEESQEVEKIMSDFIMEESVNETPEIEKIVNTNKKGTRTRNVTKRTRTDTPTEKDANESSIPPDLCKSNDAHFEVPTSKSKRARISKRTSVAPGIPGIETPVGKTKATRQSKSSQVQPRIIPESSSEECSESSADQSKLNNTIRKTNVPKKKGSKSKMEKVEVEEKEHKLVRDSSVSSAMDTSIDNASIASTPNTHRITSSMSSSFNIKHKILFTGITSDEYTKLLKKLGASQVEDPIKCTVLVTDKVRRTVKFLCALALGVPIVSIDWLIESEKMKCFVDWKNYILKDPAAEAKFGFKLRSSLDKAKEHKLLEGYSIILTPNVAPPPLPELKSIISSCGGKALVRPPPAWPQKAVIISSEKDLMNAKKFAAKAPNTVTIQSTEFLLTGILRQELDFVKYKLI